MSVGGRAVDDGLNGGRHRFGFAETGQAFVGVNHDDAVVVGAVEQADVGVFHAQMDRFDVGNLHCVA